MYTWLCIATSNASAGGFSLGDNTQCVLLRLCSTGKYVLTVVLVLCRYDGKVMVQRSVEMGQPIIFAALNYRLHGELDDPEMYGASCLFLLQPLVSSAGRRLKRPGLATLVFTTVRPPSYFLSNVYIH